MAVIQRWTNPLLRIQHVFQHANHVIIITTSNIIICDERLRSLAARGTHYSGHVHMYQLQTRRGQRQLCMRAVGHMKSIIAERLLMDDAPTLARHVFHVSRDYKRVKMTPHCSYAYFKTINPATQYHILEGWLVLRAHGALVIDVLSIIFTKFINELRRCDDGYTTRIHRVRHCTMNRVGDGQSVLGT